MTDAVAMELIKTIGTVATAFISLVAVAIGAYNSFQMAHVKKATDGMKDDLVKITGESEYAKGLLSGKAEGATVGPTGPEGPKGETGATGATGPKGSIF